MFDFMRKLEVMSEQCILIEEIMVEDFKRIYLEDSVVYA